MRLLSLFLLALLAAVPARAEPAADAGTVIAILEQVPADPAWWGKSRVFDLGDLAALKQVSGVRDGISMAQFIKKTLPKEDMQAVTSLLWRFHVGVGFREYLLQAGGWSEQLGFDFLDLAWVSQPGGPPNDLLLLGGAALPTGEALAKLAAFGLQPVERGGATVWSKGEDNSIDVKNRFVDFPFWGWLGSAARVFRVEAALVGTRNWASVDAALAVQRGEAESLADLPAYRLAADAAGRPDFSQGAVLQMTFVDPSIGADVLGVAPRADGLPPYALFAFADREDASGHQVLLVLVYEGKAPAAEAAALLPGAIAGARNSQGASLADRFPGLTVEVATLGTADGAAVVARLATPPEPVLVDGKVSNRSRLYAYVQRMLYQRDLGFLAPRG